jgi:adenosylcobinamide-GDP ribazoletransferase
MSTRWRLFRSALRDFTRLPVQRSTDPGDAEPGAAAPFIPLVGALIGAVGGLVYWGASLIWPSSIAVVLAMFATTLLCAHTRAAALGAPAFVFAVLIKYDALTALSAANLPFALPANVALGLIMIAGHAASRALVVSVIALPAEPAAKPVSNGALAAALALGFAPAALIGIPGLIGLAAAILARIALTACTRRYAQVSAAAELDVTLQLTEVCFYLGALATWAYI